MLGRLFAALVLPSVVYAALTGHIGDVCTAAMAGAAEAVTLFLSLLGTVALWSAMVNVLDRGGALRWLGKLYAPLLRVLFPRVTDENTRALLSTSFAVNLLGVGSAALPLAKKTVRALQANAAHPETATDETVLYFVLCTVPLQLFPTSLIALRIADGSSKPYAVLPCVTAAQLLSALFGIVICRLFAAFSKSDG